MTKKYKLTILGGTFFVTLALSFGAQAMNQNQFQQQSQQSQQCSKGVEVQRTHMDEIPQASHQDLKGGKKVQTNETFTTVKYTTEVRNQEEEDYESDEEHRILGGTPTKTTTHIKKAQQQKSDCCKK